MEKSTDTKKLIDIILSDDKFARSLASKVYKDEPILITASQMKNITPYKYREMRKMAGGTSYYESDTKIFYKQAKFMEDFEDEFDFRGEFARYFPTYQSMNDRELRGYFSWRTKVRKGTVDKTSLSFVFVYIYELLNQIGVKTPEEGFFKIKKIWADYSKIDSHIDHYISIWLKDYVVYYNLDKSLLYDLMDVSLENTPQILIYYRQHSPDDVFTALNYLSSYKLNNSKFFKEYPEDVKNVVYNVFSNIAERWENNDKDKQEYFFGGIYSTHYNMFSSAVFYEQKEDVDYFYEISNIHKYKYVKGYWSCEKFFCYSGKKRGIDVFLKTIDCFMRQKYSYKYTLKATTLLKKLQAIIVKEIDKYLENKKKDALPKIEIDLSKLSAIRNDALETQSKLIVDEAEEAVILEHNNIQQDNNKKENNTGLSDTEYLFTQCLLYGKDYNSIIKSKGLMISVLVDGINEKLFDLFGDTVISDNSGQPELIEDYIKQLKEMIKK